MLEAIKNHCPDVVVVDEIGDKKASGQRLGVGARMCGPSFFLSSAPCVQLTTPCTRSALSHALSQEAEAARTIAQRGAMLVATAHGTRLNDLLRNPDLVTLAGGVTSVTLGDAAAGAAGGGSKTRSERKGTPVFQALKRSLPYEALPAPTLHANAPARVHAAPPPLQSPPSDASLHAHSAALYRNAHPLLHPTPAPRCWSSSRTAPAGACT